MEQTPRIGIATLIVISAGVAPIVGALCCSSPTRESGETQSEAARLHLTPFAPTASIAPGEHTLGLAQGRDGLLYVPSTYDPQRPSPLMVMLHGAGGDAHAIASLFPLADEFRVIVLAPESRSPLSWDVMVGGFGPDVEFIERALTYTFERCAIDPSHLALAGFSDGASYALSLGLTNGDFFRQVIAFSPGRMITPDRRGKPRVFVSHGTEDERLLIDRTSDVIVPRLVSEGYDVTYVRFNGSHELPPEIARSAFEWFTR